MRLRYLAILCLVAPSATGCVGPPTLLKRHRWEVKGLSFSPDGGRLAVADTSGHVDVWSVSDQEIAFSILDNSNNYAAARDAAVFSPDGTYLVTTGADVLRMRSAHDGRILAELSDWGASPSFDADGTLLAAATRTGEIRLWSMPNGTLVKSLRGSGEMSLGLPLALSPDGALVAFSNAKGVDVWSIDGDRRVLRLRPGESDHVTDLAFSPAGDMLVAAFAFRGIHAWSIPSGELVYSIDLVYRAYDLAFSADGRYLAAAQAADHAGVWFARSGRLHRELTGSRPEYRMVRGPEVQCVAISPDGRLVATGCGGDALLWTVP